MTSPLPDPPFIEPPFIEPDVAGFLAMMAQLESKPSYVLGEIAARAQFRAAVPLIDRPVGALGEMRDLVAPGPGGDIPLRLFDPRPERSGPTPLVVFFHGGGWVLGDLDTHGPLCATIARALDLPVVAVEYRLAPEHPFPAAPDDGEAAARWLAESPAALGREVSGLILAGDSAGGALAIITALALRDAPAAVPLRALWPIYPAVGRSRDYASFDRFGDRYGMMRASMDWFAELYAPDLETVRGAPIMGEMAGLPPTFVLTAALDPVVDQGRAFAARCAAAGVAITYREVAGTIHGFANMRKVIPSAAQAIDRALALFKTMLAEAI